MVTFYGEELLAPHPTPNLEFHPLSAICNRLLNILATALHVGGHFSSTASSTTCNAVVTGTHLWFRRGLVLLIAVTGKINYVNLQTRRGFLNCE
jgi:hypothetical protein